jgi:hypothetical protein
VHDTVRERRTEGGAYEREEEGEREGEREREREGEREVCVRVRDSYEMPVCRQVCPGLSGYVSLRVRVQPPGPVRATVRAAANRWACGPVWRSATSMPVIRNAASGLPASG